MSSELVIDRGPITERADLSGLASHWLGGATPSSLRMETASRAIATALEGGAVDSSYGDDRAPAWADDVWMTAWSRRQLALQPDVASRAAVAGNLELLASGAAEVVVTGQQPGFLGGPLYTLYKVATCIALADSRTRAGRPTVPLYWSGDDDDDVAEAFSSSLWDPRRSAFLKPRKPALPPGTMVGAVGTARTGGPELAWLQEQSGSLARELAVIWSGMMKTDAERGRLQQVLLARLCHGRGLLSVSGNDGPMLAVAAPWLKHVLDELDALRAGVRLRGQELRAAGFHAQISDASLTNPLQMVEGNRRYRLEQGEVSGIAVEALRPGVMLRSPLQDWLFRPAAVIVGPGERAYLEQLRPLYQALDLRRAPLVPRLFAVATDQPRRERIEPDQQDRSVLTEFEQATRESLRQALIRAGADEPDRRATSLLARWRPALELNFHTRRAARTARPHDWRNPRGARQERAQPLGWAAALWGDQFTDVVFAAATRHLARGIHQPIAEWAIGVTAPHAGDEG